MEVSFEVAEDSVASGIADVPFGLGLDSIEVLERLVARLADPGALLIRRLFLWEDRGAGHSVKHEATEQQR